MKKTGFKKISQIFAVVAISGTAIYQYSRSDYKHCIDADKDCSENYSASPASFVTFTFSRKVHIDNKTCKSTLI